MTATRRLSGAGLKGVLYMTAFAVMFAIVERLGSAMPADFSPYQVVWGRYLVHLVLTLCVMLFMDRSVVIRSARPGVQLCRSAMMLLMPVAFVIASHEARGDLVWALLWLAPLMTMAWESWFRGATFAALDWAGAFACLAGTVLVLRPGPPLAAIGTLSSLLAAASFAAYILLTAELRGDSVRTSLFYTATVPFAVLSAVMPSVWTPVTASAGLLLVATGVVGWLALYALDRGVRLLEAGYAAVFAFLAVIAAALIAREADHAATIAGAGIIGVAVVGAAVRAVRRDRRGTALKAGNFEHER